MLAMRSSLAVLRRRPSSMPLGTRDEARVWRPSYGVVFNVAFAHQTPSLWQPSTATELERPPKAISLGSENIDILENSGSHLLAPTNGASSSLEQAGESSKTPSRQLPLPQPAKEDHHDLPNTDSSFKMIETLFRAAKDAEPGSPQSFWSHTLYNGPASEGKPTNIKIHYCRSKHTTERTLQYFINKKVIGFDIEWKPQAHKHQGAKDNVSLIQLASEDRIALFHLALFPKSKISDLVAPSLKRIMEDPTITKVGVAIKADCTRLRKYLNIEAKGIFELSHLYRLVKFSEVKDFKQINKRLVSLSTQVQEHLHLPLFKGDVVRGSDWSKPLKLDQIMYAAADAYAGIQLFDTLELKRRSLNPVPPRPYHAEENKAICFAAGVESDTDEALEEPEPDDAQLALSNKAKDYGCYASKVIPTEDLEIEGNPSFPNSMCSPPVTDSPVKDDILNILPSPHQNVKDRLLSAAESQGMQICATHKRQGAVPSYLRTYFLWYDNPDLSVSQLAALLRDPPLQESTVRSYILEAIRAEKLPYEKARLKEVLGQMPEQIVRKHYSWTKSSVEGSASTPNQVSRSQLNLGITESGRSTAKEMGQ